MEALGQESEALTTLESQLRKELRELRAAAAESSELLSERRAELAQGTRRAAALAAEAARLEGETAAVDGELAALRPAYAAQRIAKGWYAAGTPATSLAQVVISATPVKWASMVTHGGGDGKATPGGGKPGGRAALRAALEGANEGTRLRLLEKLWAALGSATQSGVAAGVASLPGDGELRAAAHAAGYEEKAVRAEEVALVRQALEKDVGRLRWDEAQLQATRDRLSFAAVSSGRGSHGRSPGFAALSPPSFGKAGSPQQQQGSGSPGCASAASRALAVSRAANRLTTGGSGRPGNGGGHVPATVYASIVPALSQLKAGGDGSLARRIAGAKAVAQAALDPQTKAAISRADGERLLRQAVADEEEVCGAGHPAFGLLKLEVDIALERLGAAAVAAAVAGAG